MVSEPLTFLAHVDLGHNYTEQYFFLEFFMCHKCVKNIHRNFLILSEIIELFRRGSKARNTQIQGTCYSLVYIVNLWFLCNNKNQCSVLIIHYMNIYEPDLNVNNIIWLRLMFIASVVWPWTCTKTKLN